MTQQLCSDILYLPGEEEYSNTILQAALLFNPDVFYSSDRALIQDSLTGLFRPADKAELIEYLEGGEYDELLSNELVYGS
jgi:hypothetical protein